MSNASLVGQAIAAEITAAENALVGTETDAEIRELMMIALATGMNQVLIPEIVPKTAAYTLTSADSGKIIETTHDVTVPPDMPDRWHVLVVNVGGSDISLVEGAGVTVHSKDDALDLEPDGAATLYSKGSSVYRAFGALV